MPTRLFRLRHLVLLFGLLAITLAGWPSTVHAQALPTLPLPDCVANGLAIDDTALCEGSNQGYLQNFPESAKFAQGAVALAIGTRDVDFRNDSDRGPQFITLTLGAPGSINNGNIIAAVAREWPQQLEDDRYVDQRDATDLHWDGNTGGKPVGAGPNPAYALLTHEGPACTNTDASCSYRVNWSAYPTPASQEPLIYRICVDWNVNYIFVDPGASNGGVCGTDPVNGCAGGGGQSCVTFKTNPPPPPHAVGKATRIASKQFAFDASESTDPNAIEEYTWTLLAGVAPVQYVHEKTFEHDYNADDLPPFVTADVLTLTVTDHYKRSSSATVGAEFLGGVPGFLQITSFQVVDVANGIATLKAVVKNTDNAKKVTAVFLQGNRNPTGTIATTPTSTELDPGETVEFTVTTPFDDTNPVFIDVTALGNIDTGPVKSATAAQIVGTPPGPGDADTTVTGTGNPDDDHLDVGDNSAFRGGDYAGIDPGPNQEVRRVKQVTTSKARARAGSPGSLVFDAPLRFGHSVGAGVFHIDAPEGDTTGPVVTVTAPLAGQAVCQGAPLAAQFSCSDAGVGVEQCGQGITNGQALDTSAFGSHQTAVRAWDVNGNPTVTTVTWSVGFCDASIDSFHCFGSKPAKGEKFTTIPGVRVAGPVDDLLVDVKKPTLFCVPADTSGDGRLDDATHLEGYAVKPLKSQPKIVPQTGVKLASQIGTLKVDTAKLASLLVPTAQDPANPPAPIGNPFVDRFACYAAKLAKGEAKLAKDLQVTVADGLTNPPKRFTLAKVASVCVPVTAGGGTPKHPDRLLCFKAAATKGRCGDSATVNAGGGCKKETECGGVKGQTTLCTVQPKFGKVAGVRVANDLGSGALDAATEAIVCLPAVTTP